MFALGAIQRIVQKVLPCFIPYVIKVIVYKHLVASIGIITVNILRLSVSRYGVACFVACIAVKVVQRAFDPPYGCFYGLQSISFVTVL